MRKSRETFIEPPTIVVNRFDVTHNVEALTLELRPGEFELYLTINTSSMKNPSQFIKMLRTEQAGQTLIPFKCGDAKGKALILSIDEMGRGLDAFVEFKLWRVRGR